MGGVGYTLHLLPNLSKPIHLLTALLRKEVKYVCTPIMRVMVHQKLAELIAHLFWYFLTGTA